MSSFTTNQRDGHYNLIPLLGLAIFAGIIASVIMFMGYASFSIVQYLRHSKIMSAKSRKLQIALFRMLACQVLFFGFAISIWASWQLEEIGLSNDYCLTDCSPCSTCSWVCRRTTICASYRNQYRALQVYFYINLFNSSNKYFSDISTVFLSFFTPIDALIVILLIKNYRDYVFFCCRWNSKLVNLCNFIFQKLL